MSDKYYNNDIKKKLGIDETRTASQKLLDRVNLTKRNKFLTNRQSQALGSLPKKKVKSLQESTPESVKERLLKSIKQSGSMAKTTKAAGLLTKCLDDEQFVKANFKTLGDWFTLAQDALLACQDQNTPKGTISELRALKEALRALLLKIKDKVQRSCPEQTFERKQNQLVEQSKEQGQQHLSQALILLKKQVSTVVQMYSSYLVLFTDDSFEFVKEFTKLRQGMFSTFELLLSEPKVITETKSTFNIKKYCIKLLFQLLNIPITSQLESTRTSLINFFKQFIINYKHQVFLQDKQTEKQFLRLYNLLLHKKSNGHNGGLSYDIMGNGGVSQKVTSLEMGGGADTWIQKQ